MHPRDSFFRLPVPRWIRVELVSDSIARTFDGSGPGVADVVAGRLL